MRAIIVSLMSFIMAFMLFATAVFAWFTLSDQTNMELLNSNVTTGLAFDYEIKYYTNDYIYKYDSLSGSIKVYDVISSSWVSPENLPGNPEFLLDGVFISKYDVLIPENNYNNNLIIEININFTNNAPIQFSQKMISQKSLSSAVISSMTLDTSRPYYVSEVAEVQTLLSNSYNHQSATYNKYNDLTTLFNSKDGSNNLIYPKNSFYQNNVYGSVLELGTNTIEANSTLRYYYNISYDAARVNSFFTSEFQNSNMTLSNIPFILFFQDITIGFIGGVNV